MSYFPEHISKLTDVLWLVRMSADKSPKDIPLTFNWRQVWGLCWPWERCDSAMRSCIVILKEECIPMPTGFGHNNSLNGIISVAQPSDILLADVESCPPTHGDPSQNDETSASVAVMCNHGWRLVTLPRSMPNPWLPSV